MATPVNDEWLSPQEIFYGSRPPLSLLPFFHLAFYRTPRWRKTEPKARMCHFLNLGYKHGRDCYKLPNKETGTIMYSSDMTRYPPEVPWITPMWNPPTDPSI